ncbi:glycosyltransferase [Roseicyclus mahoneyensis]|nr:glycosyltransferase [Roseicyclus mahoneyensis]
MARLMGQDSPFDWQAWYRQATRKWPPAEVLGRHEKAGILAEGFSVGAYLEKNPDVADVVASPGEAVFHYLEFGLAEDRDGAPEDWDAGFVRRWHGLDLPPDLTAKTAASRLAMAGVTIDAAVLSEAHLWLARGLHGPVLAKIFEHEIYAALAEAAGHALPAQDRFSAIAHFCDIGLAAGIPPHPDHRLEPDFYRAACAFAGIAAPEGADLRTLLRHWARIGLRAGAHANPQTWFKMRTDVTLPPAVLDRLGAFRDASADLSADANLPATLAHLDAVPLPGTSVFDAGEPGVQAFLLDLARRKRNGGDPGAAEWLLMRVLDRAPDNPRASLDLADIAYRQNRIGTEIQLRRAVPADFDIGANAITLAERLVAQDRLQEAMDVCDNLPAEIFGDVALRQRRRNLGAAVFGALWGKLGDHIETRLVCDVQSLLARALALYTPPFEAPRRSAPIRRVAVLANDDLYQCKLYRADQKIDQLRAAGFEADLFLHSLDLDRLRQRLDVYDAVIFMRVPAFLPIIDLITDAAQQGLETFYDCDDLIFDPALFPPPLSTYAGQITAKDHAAIACGVPLFRHAMALCAHGIASTPTMQDAMAGVVRSGKVFLHPNALGLPHLRALENAPTRKDREKLVIYYGSGTKAHKAEFAEVLEPALAEVLAKRPGKVEIRIIGDFPEFRHLDPAHPDVHLVPPIWDFEAFCAEVAEADINLSILFPSPITDAKSEIKWMEAAMFGVPSVISPTATHRAVIEDGVTGLLAEGKDGFSAAILRLVDDAGLRARIGTAARDVVMRDYSIAAMGTRLSGMFDAVRPPLPAPKARLLIVNVFYPPQDIGGATRVVQDNITDLMRLYGESYEIDVIATLDGGTTPYEVACAARDGVRVWTVTARTAISNMDISDHKMGDVFDRLLDRVRPDLVHLHCIQRLTGSIVDRLRRRSLPYVVTLHDGWWVSPNQFVVASDGAPETYDFRSGARGSLPDRAKITQRSLKGAAAILAVSESFAELHRAAGIERVDTVENGVSALPELHRVPGPPGRVRIGLIGGASRHKGYSVLRAAIEARRFRNLDLLLVDHALPRGQTRQEVWNGTPVNLLPRVPLHAVGEVYGRIDVLLAPSVWPESYGLVTREALALGLWVIASDRGAIGQDVTHGENGFVVDVSDHHGIADCLAILDAEPERFRTPPAHRPALRGSEAQARALQDVYQRVLGGVSEQEI